MGKSSTKTFVPSFFIAISILIRLMSYVFNNKNHPICTYDNLPSEIFSLDIASKLSVDPISTNQASIDFGHMVHNTPAAVFYPSTPNDIASLVKFSYNNSLTPFTIAVKGHGHSTKGQAMAPDGVVVEMASLSRGGNGDRVHNGIRIQCTTASSCFCDVSGDELWIDVLMKTIEDGLAPVSWTDYLYLSIGGTLSNGGISGQTFLHGPQTSNVLEMDVVTGKGDLVTCSKGNNTELFNAVLGGLGQFGIITRARIPLKPTPKRVKWARMLYSNFSEFTRDQEHLISTRNGADYVEGSLILHISSLSNWRSSFFSQEDHQKIINLVKSHGIIYCLEVVKYYDDQTVHSIDKEIQRLFHKLSYIGELVYTKDVTFVEFLNRVRSGELELKSRGLWDVPHPWLNLFVPKSSIQHFNDIIFSNIILQHQKNTSLISTGPILVYPTLRTKWDSRTSTVVPDEDIFYCVGFLHSSGFHEWKTVEGQNKEILEASEKAGLRVKQYLPHYKTQQDWRKHFGTKWKSFRNRKKMFDPKALLSPGQRIFN